MAEFALPYQDYVRILVDRAGEIIRAQGQFTISKLLLQPAVSAARDASFALSKSKARHPETKVAGRINGEIERRTKEAIRRVHGDLKSRGLVQIEALPLLAVPVLAIAQQGVARRGVLLGVATLPLVLSLPQQAEAGESEYGQKVARQLRIFLKSIEADITRAILG